MLPLIKSPPTDWTTLLTALKNCQKVSEVGAPGKRTITTLDLPLYIKAVQLVSTRPEMKDQFILRIGELHVLFAMCRSIGKYIEESGLDSLLTHCGIFGPVAVGKILEGKHMIRCARAFLIIYCSVYDIFLEEFFALHQMYS